MLPRQKSVSEDNMILSASVWILRVDQKQHVIVAVSDVPDDGGDETFGVFDRERLAHDRLQGRQAETVGIRLR